MNKPKRELTGIEADFVTHLKGSGLADGTVYQYSVIVGLFLAHIGNRRIDQISEAEVRTFFQRYKDSSTKRCYGSVVSQFLKFAHTCLTVPVTARGEQSPRAVAPSKKELALRQQWSLDKLIRDKASGDDLIAKLARKVIDGYLICQREIKGEQNLDDLVRYVDECRELIEANLPLFMGLSAQGKNIHSAIDERVQK